MKKKLLIAILCLIPLLSLAGNQINFNLEFDRDNFSYSTGEYTRIITENRDYLYKTTPGEPAFPCRMIKVSIPYNAEFVNINYQYSEIPFLENSIPLPIQENIPLSHERVGFTEPNPVIYQKSDQFPEEIAEYTGTNTLSRYKYVTFLVSPFIYYPEDKKINLVSAIDITINYSVSGNIDQERWDDGTWYDFLSSELVNPQDLEEVSFRSPSDPNSTEYLIITTNELAETFQQLADWKTLQGTSAGIITMEEILSSYSGSTPQLKIKNCILDHYQNYTTKWVLLGGDDTIIPVQGCYANVGNYVDETIPADLFYACFDNAFDWNANGNDLVGETDDNVDFAPEIFISRIPVRTDSQTNAYVTKLINYETSSPAESFATEMLLMGVELFNTWDGRSDADWRNEKLWNDHVSPYWEGSYDRFYDTNTDFGGPGYDVTTDHITELINSEYNYLFFATHGSTQSWATETGSNYTVNDASALDNEHPGLVVTIACNTNAFDRSLDPCLGEAFLRNENGGSVSYHGSSRYGWGINYNTEYHGASYCYADQLYYYLFTGTEQNDQFKFGAAATFAKVHYLGYTGSSGPYRWLQFSLNAMGDPKLDLLTADPQIINANGTIVPNSNPVEIEITSDSPLTSICITDLTDVYIIGETDVNGNFSCSIYGENPDALSYTLSAHNKLTFSEQINTVPVIEPPTGSGPENNPIASDVENDQGGWIRIDYILSQNDPYHSEAVTPYIDYYTIERKEGSGEWQPVANYQPQDPIDSNNGTLLIAVPASEDPCAYRMAAVYDPENSTIQSEWADAGAATSKDEIPVFVDLTLFLEGAYQDDGYMRHDLIDNDFLPLISPYNGESVDYFPETGIIPIVDWIEIQLRETEDGISLYSCNAFLLSDGSVVDINGNNSLPFFNTSDREFYLVIRHRNHIDIMTANPYILSDNPVIPSIIDLSQVDSIYGIGFTELADGTIAMLTGDGSNNNQIQNDDKNEFWINQVNYAGYLSADFNLNGQVQNDDKNEYWINNVGRGLTFPEPDPGREFNPSQRYKNNLVASGLNFSFANSQVTEDGYYFEFDIMVNSISTPALLGDTHIYLNYDPQAFGYQAVAYDGIKISKGSLLQGELIPGVALYSEPHSSDNDISRIGIHLAYNFAQLPEAANLIPTSPSCLVHVQIEIADNNASSRISFENSDRVPMNFQQYYSDNSARFNTVVTNAVLNESLDLNSFTESRNTADSYGLMDNYPNPFNAVTNICFILPEDQYCELSVYNIKGQKVKDIFRGEIVKDELNNFIWDGTDENQKNVSSGIYLYRLNAGDHSQIRKMIVNK